ncbi:hypothetical protein CEP54_011967 [Fusarium duplospermum]|uniref:Heterokaryon incompatibility domain-containing protein n=1 Tax=Fusarium duplospermum TaxID=1325734 RepID=A0A428PBL3_9HYPO|nr:hypothetical protein CEP54_011967 [Fusarium duplospermum]
MGQTLSQAQEGHGHDDTLDEAPDTLVYRPLDLKSTQIRMLHLLPGNGEDPIRCVLDAVLLDDNPKYEALSYAWGDPTDRLPIEVDGERKSITVNLYHALRRLRYPQDERRLWVDAVCINQDDYVEKSHQVSLMQKIYSSTERAILWLGEFSDGPTAAPNHIPRQTATDAFALLELMAANKHYINHREDRNKELDDKAISSLSFLVDLPWWHRAWTVQEAVLPPDATIMCGTAQFPFSLLMKATDNSLDHHFRGCCDTKDDLYLYWDRVRGLDVAKNDAKDAPEYSVHGACNLFRLRQASNPRDKVYAYFWLGKDLPVDYSLPYEEVFKRTTRSLIQQSGILQCLFRGTEEKRSSTLPTWVPDWCAEFDKEHLNSDMAWVEVPRFYKAAGKTEAITRDPSSDTILDLQGVVLDHITAVGAILADHEAIKETISLWQDQPNSQYPRGGTYREASWRTFSADIYQSPGTHRRMTSSEDAEEIANHWMKEDPTWISTEAFRKRGFTTDTGLIGLGSRDIQVGDSISVLKGGRMPFILRKVEGPGGGVAYQYIGHAYVHGIMDGEVMEEVRDMEWISLV